MKVKELIEKLSKLQDQDADVVIPLDDSMYWVEAQDIHSFISYVRLSENERECNLYSNMRLNGFNDRKSALTIM